MAGSRCILSEQSRIFAAFQDRRRILCLPAASANLSMSSSAVRHEQTSRQSVSPLRGASSGSIDAARQR
jgi:hypothetical protein